MKLVYLSIILMFVATQSNGQTTQKGPFLSETPSEITEANTSPVKGVILVIGRKSRGCSGFGICRFEIVISWDEIFNFFKARKSNNGKLDVRFSPETYNHNKSKLSNNQFVIEENFVLDSNTASELGFEKGYTIKKGTYKISFDSKTKTYNVQF